MTSESSTVAPKSNFGSSSVAVASGSLTSESSIDLEVIDSA